MRGILNIGPIIPRVKLDQLEDMAELDGGVAQDPRMMLWWVYFRRMTNAMRAMLQEM